MSELDTGLCPMRDDRQISTGMRILVVDDYCDHAEIACALLAWMGHDCHRATTGARALDLACGLDPDLALVEVSLPDLRGFEVARTLRLRARHQPYLVAMAGWLHPEHRSRALEAGFDAHVIKPLNLATLERIVRAPPRPARCLVPALEIVR